jgi:hypothetical protein
VSKLDVLLMPSAVAPSADTPFQALIDPDIRFKQTVSSIKRWAKLAEKNEFVIVVADNTGYASRIQDAVAGFTPGLQIQVIDVPRPTAESTSRGKGAGESESLLYALQQLKLDPESIVAKVNARYYTTNGLFLISEIENDFDFAAWPRPQLDTVDTTFFVGKAGFLETSIARIAVEVDDLREQFVEVLYADYSIRNLDCKFVRFNYPPATLGQSGTTGAVASRWNEQRTVSLVVRIRSWVRNKLYFIQPGYKRKLK